MRKIFPGCSAGGSLSTYDTNIIKRPENLYKDEDSSTDLGVGEPLAFKWKGADSVPSLYLNLLSLFHL